MACSRQHWWNLGSMNCGSIHCQSRRWAASASARLSICSLGHRGCGGDVAQTETACKGDPGALGGDMKSDCKGFSGATGHDCALHEQ